MQAQELTQVGAYILLLVMVGFAIHMLFKTLYHAIKSTLKQKETNRRIKESLRRHTLPVDKVSKPVR